MSKDVSVAEETSTTTTSQVLSYMSLNMNKIVSNEFG